MVPFRLCIEAIAGGFVAIITFTFIGTLSACLAVSGGGRSWHDALQGPPKGCHGDRKLD